MSFILFAYLCTLCFGLLEMFPEPTFLKKGTDLSSCCHYMEFSEEEETQYNKYGYYIKMPLRFLIQIIQYRSAAILCGMSFQMHCTFALLITSILSKLLSTQWKKFYSFNTLSPEQFRMINAAARKTYFLSVVQRAGNV